VQSPMTSLRIPHLPLQRALQPLPPVCLLGCLLLQANLE
jgi:hypothetical protein